MSIQLLSSDGKSLDCPVQIVIEICILQIVDFWAVQGTCVWGPCCYSSLTFALTNTYSQNGLLPLLSITRIQWGNTHIAPSVCQAHSRCSVNGHWFPPTIITSVLGKEMFLLKLLGKMLWYLLFRDKKTGPQPGFLSFQPELPSGRPPPHSLFTLLSLLLTMLFPPCTPSCLIISFHPALIPSLNSPPSML